MTLTGVTSAEISLPSTPDTGGVSERIAILAPEVDLVGLTDNHAGQARLSPLAAVALAREQGVGTLVHVSCRDRNRLALRSTILGAAALGSRGVVCLYGDSRDDITRVRDMNTTKLLAAARQWADPADLALGCVTDPFAPDRDRELSLLEKKARSGADFVQTQMIFDLDGFGAFLDGVRSREATAGLRVHASVALLRGRRMADFVNQALPGFSLPERAYDQIAAGGGVDLALDLAQSLAEWEAVDALHVIPLGDEEAAAKVAAAFRRARGAD